MGRTEYPKMIRKIIKEIKRNGKITQEASDRLDEITADGGWLYGVLYFKQPAPKAVEGVMALEAVEAEVTTLEYRAQGKRYIPLYTSEDYAFNIKDVVRIPDFSFAIVSAVKIQDMLNRAKASGVTGVIINPQIEGVTMLVS